MLNKLFENGGITLLVGHFISNNLASLLFTIENPSGVAPI